MESMGAADYVVAKRDQVAAAPATLDFVAAAVLPKVGLTALQALRQSILTVTPDSECEAFCKLL
jgi:NADPH:quinone reductase-like Zn-dependent oxidoreductase